VYCRAQLDELADNYAAIAGLNAEVLAVSVDNLADTQGLVQAFGLPFPVLYTSNESAVPDAYGVFALHEQGRAAPSVFIIGRDGWLRWRQVSSHVYDRAQLADILAELKKL
jgi:peroxiredoxin